jgi:hypothetical protein
MQIADLRYSLLNEKAGQLSSRGRTSHELYSQLESVIG